MTSSASPPAAEQSIQSIVSDIFMGALFETVLAILAIFLILLVLVQRGRGGGLTGALGGMGGSSAFGAKAGDVFTRITIVTAAIWICVCAAAVFWANHRSDRLAGAGGAPPSNSAPAEQTKSGETNLPAKSDSGGAGGAPAAETTTPPTTAPAGETSAAKEGAPESESK
jgi:preprotein translocase subunit SecG